MPEEKLRVLPKGTALVPNYEHQEGGRRSFHGWKHDATMGPAFVDENKVQHHHGAWVKGVGEVLEVPMRGEYIRHLRDGDLWPADVETARAAGVAFDPTFGAEHAVERVTTPAPDKPIDLTSVFPKSVTVASTPEPAPAREEH